MKVAVLAKRHWWLARRLDAAGHTVRCYTQSPRAAGDGFVEKLAAPLLPEGTELLVVDGSFPAQVQMAKARRIPVVGEPKQFKVGQAFSSLEQGLAYVATHRGPWTCEGRDGQDAARWLRWQQEQRKPLSIAQHAPDAAWVGGWADGKRVVGPFVTWDDCGARVIERKDDPFRSIVGQLAGYVGFLGVKVADRKAIEVTTEWPVAVGALHDGDLASQLVRLSRGELDGVTLRNSSTAKPVRVEEPAGYPLPSKYLGKGYMLDAVKLTSAGPVLIDPMVGWEIADGPAKPVTKLRFGDYSPPVITRGDDSDNTADESSSEPAPGSWS